jgi:hypothetical protein
MLKRVVKYLYCIVLLVSITSASIPLHNIFHNHHFLPVDDCNLKFCKNHFKSHNEHCHTFSDAVFTANLQLNKQIVQIDAPFKQLRIDFKDNLYTQYLYFTKNKAPPLLLAA